MLFELQTFGNCNCFEGTASSGYCKKNSENCPNLYKYLLTILVGGIVSSTARTANSLISFRSVDPMDKGFTMGAASSMLAIFGTGYNFYKLKFNSNCSYCSIHSISIDIRLHRGPGLSRLGKEMWQNGQLLGV